MAKASSKTITTQKVRKHTRLSTPVPLADLPEQATARRRQLRKMPEIVSATHTCRISFEVRRAGSGTAN
jgi:hypothetical protein